MQLTDVYEANICVNAADSRSANFLTITQMSFPKRTSLVLRDAPPCEIIDDIQCAECQIAFLACLVRPAAAYPQSSQPTARLLNELTICCIKRPGISSHRVQGQHTYLPGGRDCVATFRCFDLSAPSSCLSLSLSLALTLSLSLSLSLSRSRRLAC